ncbi:MAG TPA: hypothetical protein VFX84_00105 [Candidatus Saccharimonadales bacterium]|nr:hypothetical protein [Candidatus Saccharimonadales bacterium]
MLVLSFLSWWYGRGWKEVAVSLRPRLRWVTSSFSVKQLVKTLFQPWRRIITHPGSSLAEKFRAWGDNAISRAVGFVVRAGVLLAAFVTLIAVILVTLAEIIVWPLVPLAVPGLLIAGLL